MEMSPAIAANPVRVVLRGRDGERHHRLPLDAATKASSSRTRSPSPWHEDACGWRSAWRRCSRPRFALAQGAPTSAARATRTWARRCRRCRTTTRPIPACCSCSSASSSGAKPAGAADKSCADCHDAAGSMKGVAARYPAIAQGRRQAGRSRRPHQSLPHDQPAGRAAWRRKAASCCRSRPMSPISRVASRSRRRPIRGLRRSASRAQRSTSAARASSTSPAPSATTTMPARSSPASTIPEAHPTGYPIYRLEWQALGSLKRRLRNCLVGIRAEAYALRRSRIRGARDLSDGPRQGHAARRSGRTALTEGKYSPAPAPRQMDLLRQWPYSAARSIAAAIRRPLESAHAEPRQPVRCPRHPFHPRRPG